VKRECYAISYKKKKTKKLSSIKKIVRRRGDHEQKGLQEEDHKGGKSRAKRAGNSGKSFRQTGGV